MKSKGLKILLCMLSPIVALLVVYLLTSLSMLKLGSYYYNNGNLDKSLKYYGYASKMMFFSSIPSARIKTITEEINSNALVQEDSSATQEENTDKGTEVTPIDVQPTLKVLPTYNYDECVVQKRSVVANLDKKYIELYEKRKEERKKIGGCYEEKSVPECDNEMTKFNVETVELQRALVNSYKTGLTKCSPEMLNFGDVSKVVPAYF